MSDQADAMFGKGVVRRVIGMERCQEGVWECESQLDYALFPRAVTAYTMLSKLFLHKWGTQYISRSHILTASINSVFWMVH